MSKGRTENNSINFSGDLTSVQIQQGTVNSTQMQDREEHLDYEKIRAVLEAISGYKPMFRSEFGEKADAINAALDSAVVAVNQKEEPSAVKKALDFLKSVAIGTGENLIAAGIVGLLEHMGI